VKPGPPLAVLGNVSRPQALEFQNAEAFAETSSKRVIG